MKISIAWKIILGVMTVQLFTAAIIVGWFLYSVRAEVNQLVAVSAQDTVARSVDAAEDYFSPVETAIVATQRLISGGILQREQTEQFVRHLHDQLRLSPQFAGVYVGFPDGGFYYVMRDQKETADGTLTKIIRDIGGQREVSLTWRDAGYAVIKTSQDPTDTYDPRSRPWYQAAIEKTDVAWTDPYIFFTSRKPGVTAAIAVKADTGEDFAAIGIDIEISDISRYLGQYAYGPQRSAFIISRDDEIISHSSIDTVLPGGVSDDAMPRFLRLAELQTADQSIRDGIRDRLSNLSDASAASVWQQTSEGGDYVVAVGRISSAKFPWQIVTIRPAADMTQVASGSAMVLILIAFLATSVAIAVGYILARSIGRPLGVLWTNAKLARNGNIELMEETRSGYEEIDETSAILQDLAGKIRH
ncbi:hypothetical protein EJC49_23125 [Aquibium carbonis]|uniref:Cache domain-containing protein n=1 Tax=Aquibium carbonis TaxID=2495581 RepID=A0A429YMW0_9HYPH|nr:cache domain-containing protein [Aquibium carbonis]RST82806.1 hypothetical protein EJC49_23125 [Aquibium carbonis]